MSEKKYPEGEVLAFSNWDEEVVLKRRGSRERYDKDLKAFFESDAKSVKVSVKDVRLDSLYTALRDRIKKLGWKEKIKLSTRRDADKKIQELWLVREG